MSRPTDPAVETLRDAHVRLSVDEATVLLGLLDLLGPFADGDAAILALTERSRTRLSEAIAQSLDSRRGLRSL